MRNVFLWILAIFTFVFLKVTGEMMIGDDYLGSFIGAGIGGVIAYWILTFRKATVEKENSTKNETVEINKELLDTLKSYSASTAEDLLESNPVDNVSNTNTPENEDGIYDMIAEELSSGNRKESLWLKAIHGSNGDENKALAQYIEYRTVMIKKEIKQRKENEYLQQQFLEREQQLINQREKLKPKIIEALKDVLIKKGYKVSDTTKLYRYDSVSRKTTHFDSELTENTLQIILQGKVVDEIVLS